MCKRIQLLLALLAGAGSLVLLYKNFNPLEHAFFPKCPIKHVTGLDCPGCGSQRAIHFALNGEFTEAFSQNQLIFILFPYILLGFYLQLVPRPTGGELRFRKFLYGPIAIKIVFVTILTFMLLRNIL